MSSPSTATIPGHDSCLQAILRAAVRVHRRALREISISHWIRRVISLAPSKAGDPVLKLRARETKGMGPSLLFKNLSVKSVLKAGRDLRLQRHRSLPAIQEPLRGECSESRDLERTSSFPRFYLRDLASKTLDTYHMGPVLTAQGVV